MAHNSGLVHVKGSVMRNAILIILLAVVSSGAAAAWVAVDRNEIYTAYVDPATIRRNGNMVKMWDLFDFKRPRSGDGVKPHMSQRGQSEYDCQEERFRVLTFSMHSGNMAGGELLSDESRPSPWDSVPPSTPIATLWKFACGKR